MDWHFSLIYLILTFCKGNLQELNIILKFILLSQILVDDLFFREIVLHVMKFI